MIMGVNKNKINFKIKYNHKKKLIFVVLNAGDGKIDYCSVKFLCPSPTKLTFNHFFGG